MKKALFFITIIVCFFLSACENSNSSINPQIINPDNIKRPVQAFGTVKASETEDIYLPFTATIDDISVREFQTVKKGDKLLTIGYEEYLNSIASKEMQVKLYREKVEDTRKEMALKFPGKTEDSDPENLKLLNDLKYAEWEYNSVLENKAGNEELLKLGAISQEEFNNYLKDVEQKKKNYEDVKYLLDKAEVSRKTDIKGEQMQLLQLKATIKDYSNNIKLLEDELKEMRSKLKKSFLNGKFIISNVSNGLVCSLSKSTGSVITPSEKLLSIVNLDNLVVEASVDEQFIEDVKVGAKVSIIPEYNQNKKLTGKVSFISASAVQNNGETSVPIIIELDKHDDSLMLNFNVQVIIDVV